MERQPDVSASRSLRLRAKTTWPGRNDAPGEARFCEIFLQPISKPTLK